MRSLLLFAVLAQPACLFIDKATLDARLDPDDDGFAWPEDCGPDDAAVFPGATETCDGVDQDCDGEVDEALATTWYADADGDGHGDETVPLRACVPPEGGVAVAGDCDDADPLVHPGAPEADCTDATDYNCDGSVGLDDADEDGAVACDDCDDTDAARHPGAEETCDTIDQDCDTIVDEDATDAADWYTDADGDGFGDADAGVTACDAPAGAVGVATDCDDTDAAVSPAAVEVCDAADVDEDCDGFTDDADPSVADAGRSDLYADTDGDGWGSATLGRYCDPPAGWVANADDCNDDVAAVNPDASERCATAYDDDCDGSDDALGAVGCTNWYLDDDGDGYGTTDATCSCSGSGTYTATVATDCDDTSALISPVATETVNNGRDENCDGVDSCYTDADGDGYGTTVVVDGSSLSCATGTGAPVATDCDDADSDTFPGAAPSDSATSCMRDDDGDGYGAEITSSGVVAGTDCDDRSPAVNIGAVEVCENYVDDDCDGGSGTCAPGSMGLGSADAQYTGEADNDWSGSVSGGGDVNGDGYDDLVIGAWNNGDGGASAGSAYLVLGRASPASASLSSADAQFIGEAGSDVAGIVVAVAGDVDGDGYDDLLIGAYGNDDGPGTDGGAAYLVLGSRVPTSRSLSSADAQYIGEAASDMAGDAVSEAGDIDGDGYADMLVGAYLNDDGGTNAGSAYLVLGGASPGSRSLSTADAQYRGEVAADYAGEAVSGAGDVDGDGYGDLLVGASFNNEGAGFSKGAAYLILGGGSPGSRALSAADAKYVGEAIADAAGGAVGDAGDVDGDGYADMLIGAEGNDDGGGSAGAVYLILGSPGPVSRSLASADAQYSGSAGDQAGCSVSGVGDVDGDGRYDALIGAWVNSDAGSDAGIAYLVLGSGTPASRSLGSADAQFTGEAASDHAGASSSGAGDVDADGFDDLVVGAGGNDDGPGTNAGSTYLILGSGL